MTSDQKPAARSGIRRWAFPALGVAVTLLGIGLWFYAASTAPSGQGGPPARALLPSESAPASSSKRLVDDAAPAVTRLGAGFLGAFCVGYALRRFVRLVSLLIGIAILVVVVLVHYGVLNIAWADIERHLAASLGWLRGEAAAFRTFLLGYLPATGAAAFGLFRGFRFR